MSAQPAGDIGPRRQGIAEHRVGRAFVGVVVSLLAIVFMAVFILLATGPWANFQTLRDNLPRCTSRPDIAWSP